MCSVCLGPLAPRGAGHDGLHHQLTPLLPVECHGLSICDGFAGPLRDFVNSALFRPAPSSLAFDCSLYSSITLVRRSDLVTCAYFLPGDLHTGPIGLCFVMVFRTRSFSDSVFVGDNNDLSEASMVLDRLHSPL